MEDRILVWAHPRDARLTCEFLQESGIDSSPCRTWEELATEFHQGSAALVIAGELLTAQVLAGLQAIVVEQPAWSDPAVIIVGGEGDSDQLDTFAMLGNVSLLQKPLSLKTLRSTVRAALRARRRQYQVRDLLEQKDEAERRKDEYLAMLAHELRNPLAPLRTGLQLLRLGPPPDTAARTHATMERQITNLTRLVDDLLDVSRITQRKIALKRQPLDLREILRQAVDAAQPVAREKGLHLVAMLPEEPVVVDADSVRLEQMIGNVLSNAIKFTPLNGVIRVSVDAHGGRAVLRVADTGVGIPHDQLPYVFDLFTQAPRAIDRSLGGLGIGLTVVRLLAELHGGTADIYSLGEGLGAEVVIRLPLAAAREFEAAGDVPGEQPCRSARRILIVEDNHDAAEVLATYLEHLGHDVIVAHDGPAGLEAALQHQPHVLICDIGLPGMDGYEIAARLRLQSGFDSCLMIAMTGYGDVADRERGRRAGFDHHLTKPADPARIADLIATASEHAPGAVDSAGDRER